MYLTPSKHLGVMFQSNQTRTCWLPDAEHICPILQLVSKFEITKELGKVMLGSFQVQILKQVALDVAEDTVCKTTAPSITKSKILKFLLFYSTHTQPPVHFKASRRVGT